METNTSINYNFIKRFGIVPAMKCVCYRTFSDIQNLKSHQLICEAVKKKGTQCLICLRSYKTHGSLRGHLRYHHVPRPLVFICSFCGDIFTRPWSRSRHERKQHRDQLHVT